MLSHSSLLRPAWLLLFPLLLVACVGGTGRVESPADDPLAFEPALEAIEASGDNSLIGGEDLSAESEEESSDELPAEESLQAKILRGHPQLEPLKELFDKGRQAYADIEFDLAEEYFFLLKGELEHLPSSEADSLSLLYVSSMKRKLEYFSDILMEERFFADSYAPTDEALGETYAQLRSRYELPEPFLPPAPAPSDFERDLLLVQHERVDKWLRHFQGRGRSQVDLWLKREAEIGPTIKRILEEEGLPPHLIALAMIESNLAAGARSRAAAVGYWQFVRSTAKLRGLQVDQWVDERRDLEESTRAATRHLRLVHNMFRDWSLALAAYNAGEYRIQRAMGLQGDTDFWNLRLPRETRDYVPKFIAAARIISEPERYGFSRPSRKVHTYDRLTLDDSWSLDQVARATGAPLSRLRSLNPQLLSGITPPGRNGYKLYVPTGYGGNGAAAKLASIPADERIAWQKHTLKKGETLGSVAGRYGTSARAIQELNGIRNPRRVRAGTKLTIPVPGGGRPGPVGEELYRVRSGDTLAGIARRHGTTVKRLRANNGIKGDRIRVGQELRLPGSGSASNSKKSYVVRGGDTLSHIGRRFGISVDDLTRANNLRRSSILKPGMELRIPARGGS